MGNVFSNVKVNMATEPEVLITYYCKYGNIVPKPKWGYKAFARPPYDTVVCRISKMSGRVWKW